MNRSGCDHLSRDLVFRAFDGELTPTERSACESHLASCETCRENLDSLGKFSLQIDDAIESMPLPSMAAGRRALESALEASHSAAPMLPHPGKVMRRFGWGMGIAAALALGILFAPRHDATANFDGGEHIARVAPVAPAAPIEIDGEVFQPVPYSNDDLFTSAPHIVQMEIPISSLADAGIVMESVTNRVASFDTGGSVLADVLVGADGQPRGVHVLDFE